MNSREHTQSYKLAWKGTISSVIYSFLLAYVWITHDEYLLEHPDLFIVNLIILIVHTEFYANPAFQAIIEFFSRRNNYSNRTPRASEQTTQRFSSTSSSSLNPVEEGEGLPSEPESSRDSDF